MAVSQDRSVEISASMLPTLRGADRNRQPFRYFRNFQQAQLATTALAALNALFFHELAQAAENLSSPVRPSPEL
jgi:hypothetical protein